MVAQLHLAENAWSPFANLPLLSQAVGPDGKPYGPIHVNSGKFAQKWLWLTANNAASGYATTIAANQRNRIALSPPPDQGGSGDASLSMWWAASTGAFAVQATALGLGSTKLSNQPVESTLLFGSNPNLPGRLLQPIFVPATTSLDLELVDLSGAENTVRIVGKGYQFVDPKTLMGKTQEEIRRASYNPNVVPFFMTWDNGAQVTVTANQTMSFTMTVPSEGDFNAFGILGRATSITGLTLQIYEGNRRRLMDRPIRLDQVIAYTNAVANQNAASLPLYCDSTHLFERKTQITFELTDSSGSDNVVSLCMPGQLVYYTPQPTFSRVASAPQLAGAYWR